MRRLFQALFLSLLVALPADAQETRGNISGTVEDIQGVVPGASVKISSVDTGATQTIVTNGRGYFEAPLLQPGNYQVSVEMAGYKTLTRTGIVLAVGQQLSLALKLEIGQLSEQVSVTTEAPLLDTVAVSSGQNFDSRMVEGLPMFSNMPIMLTRFASGVNPSTNQSLVSQGFVDGTTQAAGGAIGGVGSNNYSIDGASNNGSGRRIASSPNADTIQEMRVESSNFDSSVGHGTGLQISMMTRAGTNAYRGTANYQYWTNRLNALNPSQRLTLRPGTIGRELYGEGRSHNLAITAGGPIINNKLFFFANYSYVNDYIPGKNQGTSTVPANLAHLNGDFSDLLRLPNPAQYQIYDPLTVRPDPNNPNRFIRSPFPNNIIPQERIVNPLYNLYRQMVPSPNQNFVEDGTTPSNNYYRGGEPDIPISSLFGGRVDYMPSNGDRFFFRGSGSKFLEGVSDWTYEVPAFQGLHSIDRSRYTWALIGSWTKVLGTTVVDTQVASNEFFQDDLLERLHAYKPSDMGMPSYLDSFCSAQNDCMLPVIGIGGYQGISTAASSGDRTRNVQGKADITHVRGSHTFRSGIDVRTAERERGPGGNPSGNLSFTNDFTRQASDNSQQTPSNIGLSLAAFMLGIPTTSSATIQTTAITRNNYLGAYGQDSWRVNRNLTVNLGLRVEWENGIREIDGRMLVDFDPTARVAISDLAEAAYARSPIPQLPASEFKVNGGSVYATSPGRDGATWKPETLWMPRLSFAYKLGDKMVLKGGYGVYFDTLNANDYNANVLGFSSTTTNTNSTNFGQTFLLGNPYAGVLGISDPFPVRADGSRFDTPFGSSLGVDTVVGSGYSPQNYGRQHARQQRWRVGVQREVFSNLSVEVAYDGSYSDRIDVNIRQDYLPEQYWIPGSLNARDATAQANLVAQVTNPFALANFDALRTSNPLLFQRMASNAFFSAATVERNRLLRAFPHINNLTYDNLPLGEAKVDALAINVNRRFSGGFTANATVSFTNSRSNRTVEQYDRAPTLWQRDNNSRPFRVSGGAVYELPFGTGRKWLAESGLVSSLVGGWQTAGTFEYQPGSLIQFNNNLFFYGNIDDIKKDKPEIALNADGTINPDKYWFNVANFETSNARTPTSFQTRAFPFQIEGLRGPGLMYANLNFVRTFVLEGRRTLQARVDIQNLFNYAAYNNPTTDPTNTNFGKVTTAVASAGAMRFFSFTARFTF